jgi:FKBP-type peptidyl-prolyl cis-trans isomerase FkpA
VIPKRTGKILVVSALLSALVVSACDDSPTAPAPAFTQNDLRVGTGEPAAAGDTLRVQYTGWIFDGTKQDQKGLQFDSNVGGTDLQFVLGTGMVILGWDQGLIGVQSGGVRRLVIPPELAYGNIRKGPIPPNSTLIFDIEVTGID